MAAHTLIVMLYEEAEAKKKRKYGISLAAKHKKQSVPNRLIGKLKPDRKRRRIGELIEIEVLDGVEQYNGQYGKAAQHIGHIHPGMSFYGFHSVRFKVVSAKIR